MRDFCVQHAKLAQNKEITYPGPLSTRSPWTLSILFSRLLHQLFELICTCCANTQCRRSAGRIVHSWLSQQHTRFQCHRSRQLEARHRLHCQNSLCDQRRRKYDARWCCQFRYAVNKHSTFFRLKIILHLEVRFSRWGAIQIYVYLYLYIYTFSSELSLDGPGTSRCYLYRNNSSATKQNQPLTCGITQVDLCFAWWC